MRAVRWALRDDELDQGLRVYPARVMMIFGETPLVSIDLSIIPILCSYDIDSFNQVIVAFIVGHSVFNMFRPNCRRHQKFKNMPNRNRAAQYTSK